jgi:hypothetical protein
MSGLGQAQKYGALKQVNGVLSLPHLIIGSSMVIKIQANNK